MPVSRLAAEHCSCSSSGHVTVWRHAVAGGGGGSAVLMQRRFSFKYAQRVQHTEMQQPFFIHEKMHGLFSNERNIRKARRGLPYITPLYTKHMNLWETDTDASTNRYFRSYVFGQRELHQLLGRPHGFEANEAAGRQGDSAYELLTDQRFKGMQTPMGVNLHYESEWNYTLYAHQAHQENASCTAHAKAAAALVDARPPTREELLGRELALAEVRDRKSVEHCKAWFDRLQYLIRLHFDAVGDIGEFRSRHTQHVHEFFVAFHDAISSFDFQDRYLFQQFQATRPKELEDLFGIFMDMEANYVNLDYCPRCSLPYATTRYCGEGDSNTPFRRHRGRWAPHQSWGKEWFDVVTRRAEALWYRSTEDPYFGTPRHTQRQVEALLRVYCQTFQRAKALDFLHVLRGSVEFLSGQIHITSEMEQQLNDLLDRTEHPHLLTNKFRLQSRASVYTGEIQKVPHSPLQLLLDMKLNVFRRQQREEGVVRVPPASWRISTSAIVPYKLDPQTKQVTNWREVKAGIEKAFLDAGLPLEAYTPGEWRTLCYWKREVTTRGARRAVLEAERQRETSAAQEQGRVATTLLFPTAHWYQVFDTSPEAMAPFAGLGFKLSSPASAASKKKDSATTGTLVFECQHVTFANPRLVEYEDPKTKVQWQFDVTPEASAVYGDFVHGEVLRVRRSDTGKSKLTELVVVVGVSKTKNTAAEEGVLYAMFQDTTLHLQRGLLKLGKDSDEVHRTIFGEAEAEQHSQDEVEPPGRQYLVAPVPFLDTQRTAKEKCIGQVVGVRRGSLYVQWRLFSGARSALDRTVALPLGTPEVVKQLYISVQGSVLEPLPEPPSWWVPFRNDHAEERLKEAIDAPFQREKWASLIPGKYTPKKKHFGYTQHNTQDDFMTKEYRDRLLSRQFFHQPQMFEVLPERHEKSVRFGGKWESQRVCGFPSVDRNELEKGWGEVDLPITNAEMAVMEQAIRDIGGDRPGNYIKSLSETQNLKLNESWWAPQQYGWEEQNRFERAFHHRLEQGLVDSRKLPFQGTIPPFGTSYGIGERIRDIVRDYSKGFGLGPTGHTPTHDLMQPGGGLDDHHLEMEAQRVQTLGLGNALVRLFDTKLHAGPHTADLHGWAMEQASKTNVHVRSLLLSLHEWREKGRQPSLLLQRVLASYLQDEIQLFNEGLPADVPRLCIAASETSTSLDLTGSSSAVGGQIWAEVDRRAYGYEYVQQYSLQQQEQDTLGVGYVVNLVQQACVEACFRGSHAAVDERSRGALLDSVGVKLHMALSRVANKGVPSEVVGQMNQTNAGNKPRNGAVAVPMVRGSEVAKVLKRFGVTEESIAAVLRGLSTLPGHRTLEGTRAAAALTASPRSSQDSTAQLEKVTPASPTVPDVVVPIAQVLAWAGPWSTSSDKRNSGSKQPQKSHTTVSLQRATSAGAGAQGKMMVHVMEELALHKDGLMVDIQYLIQQNLGNPVLRQEFMQAFLPVYRDPRRTAERYEAYATGKFVPNVKDAIQAFISFLGAYSTKGEAMRAAAAVDYFEPVKISGTLPEPNVDAAADLSMTSRGLQQVQKYANKGVSVQLTPSGVHYAIPPRIRLLPPHLGAFQFESTLLEEMETFRIFETYGIFYGPNAPSPLHFIGPTSTSTNYVSTRMSELIVVSSDKDCGLMEELKRSAHITAIKKNKLLSWMIDHPGPLVNNFNRFCVRVLPMLAVFHGLMGKYNQSIEQLTYDAESAKREMGKITDSEFSPAVEMEFRRNAERYWRNVLEGRTGDELLYGRTTSRGGARFGAATTAATPSSSNTTAYVRSLRGQGVRPSQGPSSAAAASGRSGASPESSHRRGKSTPITVQDVIGHVPSRKAPSAATVNAGKRSSAAKSGSSGPRNPNAAATQKSSGAGSNTRPSSSAGERVANLLQYTKRNPEK